MTDWKNRIIETAEMKVSDLKANPKNWRKHPTAQQNALAGVLDEVGWVTQVIWNRRTGHLIDGHLRVDIAAKRNEKTVPVNVVDLSEEEEAMILATFDPTSSRPVQTCRPTRRPWYSPTRRSADSTSPARPPRPQIGSLRSRRHTRSVSGRGSRASPCSIRHRRST